MAAPRIRVATAAAPILYTAIFTSSIDASRLIITSRKRERHIDHPDDADEAAHGVKVGIRVAVCGTSVVTIIGTVIHK
jgi:hypothetical protein